MKKFISGICVAMLLMSVTLGVTATDKSPEIKEIDKQTIEATYTETVASKTGKASIPKEIKYNGKTYTLKGSTQTEVLPFLVETEEPQDFERLAEEAVPETMSKEIDSTSYPLTLKEVSYTPVNIEDSTQTVTKQVTLGFYPSKPTADQTESIPYDTPEGEQTAVGELVSLSPGTNRWQDGYTITANYYGENDVLYYDFDGAKIPNPPGDDVPYIGYESAILGSLGLSADTVKINSATWYSTGTENGMPVRYASLNCSRYGADYTATYEATVPTYKTEYTARAIYTGQAPSPSQYTLKTTVQYERMGMSTLQITLLIIVILVLLSLFIIGILFIIKNQKEKGEKKRE